MSRTRRGDRVRQRSMTLLHVLQTGDWPREALMAQVMAEQGEDVYGDSPEDQFERDKTYLKSLGFEIEYDRQANVYHLSSHNPFLRLPLDREEGRLLAIMRHAFRQTPYASEVETLLGRLAEQLPPAVQAEMAQDPPLAILLTSADDLNPHHASFQAVERAVRERRELEFDYHSPQAAGPKHHRIQPYDSLEYRDGHFYFSGHSVKTGYSYEYRVDRIVSGTARALPQKYAPPSRHNRPLVLRYRLAAKIAGQAASRRFPAHQEERLPNGDIVVTAQITEADLFWATKTLLRYGENCEVLDPPELVAEMKRIVREMAACYGDR